MKYKLTAPKAIQVFALLCFSVYFSSYITRINYTAIIAAIIQEEGILKSTASLVTVVGFIAYGIGQLISGYIGDHIHPRLLIFGGLSVSSILNICMPVSGNITIMTAIWLLNGFAQAMIWPPLVRILSTYLLRNDFNNACVTVSIGSSAGTIAVYVLSPLVISLSGWKTVFWISGIIGIIVSCLWLWGASKLEVYAVNNGSLEDLSEKADYRTRISIKYLIFPSGLLYIIGAIILQGTLRDGVTTWMPSFLMETFDFKSSVSIFTTVFLPVFGILFLKLTIYLQRRYIKNEILCAGIIFFAAFIISGILAVMYNYNAAISVLLMALITGCMHGINLILVCLIPGRFEQTGKVAYISGLLNFFTYVGSAVSTYGVAKLCEYFGWQFTIRSWAVTALMGAMLCFLCSRRWSKYCR